MRLFLSEIFTLTLLLVSINASGVGKAWRVLPYTKIDYWDHPSWPRLDTSAFEVRTVSGVGRLATLEDTETPERDSKQNQNPNELNAPRPEEHFQDDKVLVDQPGSYGQPKNYDKQGIQNMDTFKSQQYEEPITKESYDKKKVIEEDDNEHFERVFKAGLMLRVLQSDNDKNPEVLDSPGRVISRVRRDAENETKLEKIATSKNVREVRMSSPETWSTQPISVEFRHRTSLDQMIQQAENEEDTPLNIRSHHVPHADFVTSPHRRSYSENRESRDMPSTKSYDDYEVPWYRNTIRDREYEPMSYRRSYNYYYPDRYRTERDYYMRMPNEPLYYYDRYRDDDFDLYGRSRPTPKPKRIIYYATLPEVVRKPVDLRNYPRPYDGLMRSSVSRDANYKRVPGNVDPSRYRYRNLYDGYDSYSKRSNYYDRPYSYPEDDGRRKDSAKESLRNNDPFDQHNDRKLSNQISGREEGKLPWPVQIGTEVSVKDDERIPGRKIFGENNGYERFQSAQMQKAPDATGSSELQSDN